VDAGDAGDRRGAKRKWTIVCGAADGDELDGEGPNDLAGAGPGAAAADADGDGDGAAE